jgi:DNA-binding YbaB/EbfC family protein
MKGHDMDRMIRRAQRMEKRVEELKKELAKRVFDGSAGGLVEAKVNGDHELVGLTIAPEAAGREDVGRLERLVMEAVNSALGRSKAVIDKEMRRATKGFSVPGM